MQDETLFNNFTLGISLIFTVISSLFWWGYVGWEMALGWFFVFIVLSFVGYSHMIDRQGDYEKYILAEAERIKNRKNL